MNLYSYVNSDPVNFIDPSGEAAIVTTIIVVGGLVWIAYNIWDAICGYTSNLDSTDTMTQGLDSELQRYRETGRDVNALAQAYLGHNKQVAKTAECAAKVAKNIPGPLANGGAPNSIKELGVGGAAAAANSGAQPDNSCQ